MKYIILAMFLPLILTGCLKTSNTDKDGGPIDVRNVNEEVDKGEITEVDNSEPGGVKQLAYDLAEIAKHDNAEDCWLLIDGKIYDVTPFIAGGKHGGGDAILEGCGIDSTELYKTRPMGSGTEHSETAYGYLDNFFFANLKK
jgi:cytochrome b involved in lipid metabolism